MDFTLERELSPGVTLRFDGISSEPLVLLVLTAKLDTPGLRVEVEKGGDGLYGSGTVDKIAARMAERYPAAPPVAIVNGDFWLSRAVPVNMFVDEGTIWKAPWSGAEGQRRSLLMIDDRGQLSMGLPRWYAALQDPSTGNRLTINAVNSPLGTDDKAVAWTMPAGEVPASASAGARRMVLKLDKPEWLPNEPRVATVDSIGAASEPYVIESPDVVVVDLAGAEPRWLIPGGRYHLNATLDNVGGRVTAAMGGGPRLLANGAIVVEESVKKERIAQSFDTARHPRTALGLNADGTVLYLVVADGRQPGLSRGIPLRDLAQRLLEMGCTDAMNLDGGGSSSLWALGGIANFPSDRDGPRPVSTSLLLRYENPEARGVAQDANPAL